MTRDIRFTLLMHRCYHRVCNSSCKSSPKLCPLQLHTSELDDGYDWNKLNLKSVTEESRLDEFLATAELAGTEFTAGGSPPSRPLTITT